MQTSGIASTNIDIVDLSVIVGTGLKGITGVSGITAFGRTNKAKLIGSWLEYVRNFGGLLPNSDFPLICKRALESGAKLYVNRVGHYTNIDDVSTLVGVKATGVLAVAANVVNFEAESVGAWGNGITVVITAAVSGLVGKLDITINIAGHPALQQIATNVSLTPTNNEREAFNAAYKYVRLNGYSNNIPVGTVVFTSGAENISLVTPLDYIGSSVSVTGIHAFDEVVSITKIACPAIALPVVDIAMAAYVTRRKDLIALTRTPVGVNGELAVDYREGTGAYSHTAINNWRVFMHTGGLRVLDPLSGIEKEITELGDVIGAMARRDNKDGEWFTFGGPRRGKIGNALGVVYNFGSAARAAEADLCDQRGLNMTIDHPDFGTVIWGNGTLQKEDTMLKAANVAELLILLTRSLKPVVQVEGFEPNDIQTWKAIHRKVVPLMEFLANNRAIWKWKYEGDQDIDNINQAQVNAPSNIDSGAYIFRLFVAPKVGLKYIGITVAVTNSSVDYELVNELV